MTRLLIAALALLLATPLYASELSSLEEQMTGEEFRQAGLEKLSKEELRFLNDWIRGKRMTAPTPPPAAPSAPAATASASVATTSPQPASQQAPAPAAPSGQGFEYKRKRSTIVSRIDGPFEGWSGKTTFKLENGMVWQQAQGGRWGRRTVDSPEVRIEPKVGGSWRLYVEGSNRSVKVKRIK
ncbi:MAG: hypothetical protein QNJ40_21795 [Xanthomonadales bacterium]|nr:hypothetical protein [Xanthomonadales bacterium]